MDPKKPGATLRSTLLTIKMDMVYRGVKRDAAEARFAETVGNVSGPAQAEAAPAPVPK
jgi:hypothetical protein